METTPMPHAPMAEKALLSCMMQQSEHIARALGEGLTRDHFWIPAHRKILDDIYDMHRSGESFDIVTYYERLNAKGEIEGIGGPSTISEIYTYAFNSGPWSSWMELVRESKIRRDVRDAAQALTTCEDATESLRLLNATLETVSRTMAGPSRSMDAKTAAQDFIQHIESLAHNGAIPGLETGFPQLDALSGGMRAGELWVVAGKPSQGKSVLLLQTACHSLRLGKRVAIFSLEMMNTEVIGRCLATLGPVNFGAITQPRTAIKQDLQKVQRVIQEIAECKLTINDDANQTIDTITAEATRLSDQHGGLDLIVVDYLQLVSGDRQRGENREQEIARVSRGLKQLAKKLRCPVLSASQLNDEGRVRESRAIEQDADALLGIFDNGVKIGKLRNGRRSDLLPLRLNGTYQRFEPFDDEKPNET